MGNPQRLFLEVSILRICSSGRWESWFWMRHLVDARVLAPWPQCELVSRCLSLREKKKKKCQTWKSLGMGLPSLCVEETNRGWDQDERNWKEKHPALFRRPHPLCSWGALGPSPSVPFTEEPASNWSSGPKKTQLWEENWVQLLPWKEQGMTDRPLWKSSKEVRREKKDSSFASRVNFLSH